MKRLVTLLLVLCGTLAAQPAATLPAPTGYVDDYAHVLSGDVHTRIEALCRAIHDQTRAQVFLVTVPSLGGSSIEQFSNDLFHQWKIGEKGTDRGVLVLFATGERMHRIEVGYGFEGTLNDARAGDIGRAITPALHARHYDQAALEAVTELADVITPNLTPPTPAEVASFTPATDQDAGHAGLVVLLVLLAVAIFGVVLFLLLRRKRDRDGGTLYGSDLQGYPASDDVTTGSLFSSAPDSSSSDSSSSDASSGTESFTGGDGGDSGGGGASGSDGDSGGGDSGGGDSGGGDSGGGDGGGSSD